MCPRLNRIIPAGMSPWLDRKCKDGVCSHLNRVIPSEKCPGLSRKSIRMECVLF